MWFCDVRCQPYIFFHHLIQATNNLIVQPPSSIKTLTIIDLYNKYSLNDGFFCIYNYHNIVRKVDAVMKNCSDDRGNGRWWECRPEEPSCEGSEGPELGQRRPGQSRNTTRCCRRRQTSGRDKTTRRTCTSILREQNVKSFLVRVFSTRNGQTAQSSGSLPERIIFHFGGLKKITS